MSLGINCTSEVLPLPVCPTMATVAPAGMRRSIPSSAFPAGCCTTTPRNSISPRSGSGKGSGEGGSAMEGSSARIEWIRSSEAVPLWTRLTTQPKAIMGHTSIPM